MIVANFRFFSYRSVASFSRIFAESPSLSPSASKYTSLYGVKTAFPGCPPSYVPGATGLTALVAFVRVCFFPPTRSRSCLTFFFLPRCTWPPQFESDLIVSRFRSYFGPSGRDLLLPVPEPSSTPFPPPHTSSIFFFNICFYL